MKPASPFRIARLTAAALALSLLAACGDDKDPVDPPDEQPETKPLYAVVAQVSADNESQSYIIVTDTVDHTTPLSLEKAIEVPGRALGSGVAKSGTLYISSSEGANVTRYDLNSSGTLEQKATVSFAGKGVATIGEYQNQFQFVSSTKAYYFDGRTSQVIVWNPSDMTLTNAVPVANLSIQGATTTFATHPVRSGDLVLMPVGWRTGPTSLVKLAGVIVVDTKTDAVKLVTDDRCAYVRDGVLAPDGKVYLATEAFGTAVYRVVGGETPKPCLLKFDPATQTFDGTFHRELSSFTGGAATGSLLPGPSGTAYLRVLDESVYTVTPDAAPRAVASAQAWAWWQLKFDTLTATKVAGLPASTGSSFIFNVADNRALFTEFTNSSSQTNLRDLSSQNGTVAMSTQGLVFSFLQIR
ncbi:hypothetical protein [Pyxidicoccus sp. MSG2]|uniref:hypothetical protein n=1 Tax=Pyxidicoccus sp. MSG2 TaxID=2996790 RepID=UPI00227119B2|nr:hypothetical protein [Pyxidicoccus sp. MSG2]MCY1023001.1 hypothetical protein [Pyxidicoccus sp. MSG2]